MFAVTVSGPRVLERPTRRLGFTCGMTGDDMEKLVNKMTMNRDLRNSEVRSDVKSGAAMQATDKTVSVRQPGYEAAGFMTLWTS